MPLFSTTVKLDENALMPLLSKPAKGTPVRLHEDLPSVTPLGEGFVKILERNLEQRKLPREVWTFDPSFLHHKKKEKNHTDKAEAEGCRIVSTFLKGKANPERQCLLWVSLAVSE